MKINVMLVTYNRLSYTKKSLPTILENAGIPFELTIYDNNSTDGTIDYLKQLNHPYIKQIHYMPNNYGLGYVTNRFWKSTETDYFGKVDNDVLMPDNWLKRIVEVHENNKGKPLGAIGGCAYFPQQYPKPLAHEIKTNKSDIIPQKHIGGCCYLIKPEVIKQQGWLMEGRKCLGWTIYQHALHDKGFINGYVNPISHVEHMDDPLSKHYDRSRSNIKLKIELLKERNVPMKYWKERLGV